MPPHQPVIRDLQPQHRQVSHRKRHPHAFQAEVRVEQVRHRQLHAEHAEDRNRHRHQHHAAGAHDAADHRLETKHYQNAKYFTWTDHLILPEPIVIAKSTWTKLNPEQQALVQKLAREAQFEERELWDKKSAESVTKLKAGGVEFITLTPEQKKAFYDATQPVRDKYGADYKDLISRIEAVQ